MKRSCLSYSTKSLLALLVVLLVSAPYALAADEPVIWLTSVQGGREPEENPLFEQEVERLTGIKVKLVKPAGSEYTTKMTAMLATGEPLDIVYMNSGSFYALKDQDLFEPLTEWIKNSPVLSDPEIIAPSEWERITQEDGEIYGVFNKFEQGTLPIVRADWMEKLGFDPPETLDDYYELLKAFTL
jgi:putative aldouronate transport system substrate-binding protein